MDTKLLTLDNVHSQFCSDWLKDEIYRIIKERDNHALDCQRYCAELKEALEEILALKCERESWGNEFSAVSASKQQFTDLRYKHEMFKFKIKQALADLEREQQSSAAAGKP